MRNIRLLIEYEGTQYAGWQWQKNQKTIQETLSKAVERVVQEPVKMYGSSRTDSGVHALGQVANFKTTSAIPPEQLIRAINFYLPHDITVKDAADVLESFHARYDAQSKIYRYTLLNDWIRTSLNRNFCHVCGLLLNTDKMLDAAQYLIGTHDFTSFTTRALQERNRIRTIKRLEIAKEGKYILFTVEADGFLYNMVRTMVGTLIEVGRGKIMTENVRDILAARNRNLAGPTAPAKGLCLIEVKY
ncbi:tRNA pseudouridine synthase A [Candidatus Brocadiaceae bacterium B188]|jgi:tRNA pseudouridine38-40 synthase|nr:tRNA pseudouridine(38-40) synthase TruA [Candidatus Brocadia sapporoensis]OQZ04208.1 MAG: tRNA pseudouridine(38-40) synthase TruA [Candidatus Brocadia sp. UTAMX1]QQR66694.1 MAG: tRNA pseudouridine(38-40) synthase TruA [Candidatus Brocadia sp.]RZV59326.1 MAG: tRNA pseudouridine(38-40) synthase TruA [Candidatus Brocadia sp. BROELEC01]TWU53660.1 tRNA pseudouridine synthase A [Candidatus Brocadiaceae bacterium B188]